jgi:predicted Zn-dependent protease
LIQVNLRLAQQKEAAEELDNFLTYLQSAGRRGEAIPFLEDLINEDPKQIVLRSILAEEYRQADRLPDAIAQLDEVGNSLLEAGNREGAIQTIEAIIAMNPPNVADYTTLLAKVKSGE